MRRERCGILKRYVARERARELADSVDSNLAIQAGFYQVVRVIYKWIKGHRD